MAEELCRTPGFSIAGMTLELPALCTAALCEHFTAWPADGRFFATVFSCSPNKGFVIARKGLGGLTFSDSSGLVTL